MQEKTYDGIGLEQALKSGALVKHGVLRRRPKRAHCAPKSGAGRFGTLRFSPDTRGGGDFHQRWLKDWVALRRVP
jgi:hypothetical protein